MFENLTTLTELNQARAKAYAASPKEEWPVINAAYAKATRELRQKRVPSARLVIESLRPRIDITTGPDTVTDAMYSKEYNLLYIIKYQPTILRIIQPVNERVIELDISSSPIAIGVSL